MTALMYRLQTMIKSMPELPAADRQSLPWEFSDFLEAQGHDFFYPLLYKHLGLNTEYSVFCAQLSVDLLQESRDEREITEQVASALMMSEVLAYLYRHYLNVPREIERLRKDQLFYQKILSVRGYEFKPPVTQVEPDTLTQNVRTMTANSNWLRLFLVRSKRFLDATALMLKSAENYRYVIQSVNIIANPALSYLSWLFFVPRLSANLFVLGKHLIPCKRWMSEKERALGWSTRLQVHFQRRWFEVGNDSIWLMAGILNCFVLVGPLAPVGAYMTTVLFAYDILLAGIRAYLELGRLETLRNDHMQRIKSLEQQNNNPAELDEARRYLTHLDARIRFEQKRLLMSVANTTLLFLAMVLTVPVLTSLGPLVPLIAGALLVTITIAGYFAFSALEKQRPADKITQLETTSTAALKRLGLFADDAVPEKPKNDLQPVVEGPHP